MKNCNNPAEGWVEKCNCNPNGAIDGVCFYGLNCELKYDECDANTKSCNLIENLGRRDDISDKLCNPQETPKDYCSSRPTRGP